MTHPRRTALIRITTAAACVAMLALAGSLLTRTASAADPSLGQLQSQLGHQEARTQTLSQSITTLNGVISTLSGQIALVQGREQVVAGELATDRRELTAVQSALARELVRLTMLRDRLALARSRLARQLRSGYESPQPDVISVVLNAHGFSDLLDELSYLGDAEDQQQTTISFTRVAKLQADQAERRLAQLQQTDRQITQAAALRVRALAGMNELLTARENTLALARNAQREALIASQNQTHVLRGQIATVRARQAAAARAAQLAAQQVSAPIALGASGGWVIPYAIVLCESGGQNLPPNSAGASGYYQIIPSTWKLFGGTGPAAYLAPKAEQDAVAARIWRGVVGASNWVCAGIVGIH
jgi:septal ring factor EnvC (AmiA/AmiB activator)